MTRAAAWVAASTLLSLLASCATAPPAPQPPPLTVMSWNVGDAVGAVPEAAAVVEVMAEAGWRDVYLLQEVRSGQHAAALRNGIERAGGGDYHLAYEAALGTAVLSRMPLEEPAVFVAPSSPLRRGALMVRAASVRGITLVDVHLDPVEKSRDRAGRVDMGLGGAAAAVLREMFTRTARSAAARELVEWLDRVGPGQGEPVVIGGDFNTVPSSAAIRAMTERYVDAAAAHSAATGRPLRGTYKRVRVPLRPRIDFVFVSAGVRVVDAGTLRRTPGDHYPVLATLELAP